MNIKKTIKNISTTRQLKKEANLILSMVYTRKMSQNVLHDKMFDFEKKIKTLSHKNIIHLIYSLKIDNVLKQDKEVIKSSMHFISLFYNHLDLSKITNKEDIVQLYEQLNDWDSAILEQDNTFLKIKDKMNLCYDKTIMNFNAKPRIK